MRLYWPARWREKWDNRRARRADCRIAIVTSAAATGVKLQPPPPTLPDERLFTMKLLQILTAGALTLSLAAGSALAQSDKAKKQAELRKVTNASLEKFYKAEPKLKGEVAKAPGYAVFTTYGLSFLIGGQGGKGIAHNAKTKHDTYMEMAQASAGLQIGASESEILIVFKTTKALDDFVTKGWEFSGGGGVQAGAGGKSVGPAAGQNVINDGLYYTLTKNGLQAGGAVAGTKFWKDKELN
jgi:lipid-binding SYLF domain-containing protein